MSEEYRNRGTPKRIRVQMYAQKSGCNSTRYFVGGLKTRKERTLRERLKREIADLFNRPLNWPKAES